MTNAPNNNYDCLRSLQVVSLRGFYCMANALNNNYDC